MLALILVLIRRPMPVGSRRRGARSPRSTPGSWIAAQRCATVWLTQRRPSAAAPGWPTATSGYSWSWTPAGACPPLPARCLRLAGITRRPRATSSRTNSGETHSRRATRCISAVTTPFRAASSCVMSRFPPPALSGSGSRGQRFAPLSQPPPSGRLPQRRARPWTEDAPRSRTVRRRGKLGQMPVAHLAARHAARARRRIEHLVRPATERAVVAEDGRRIRADAPEIVVWRIDLGRERASVEAALRGEHREAAHAARAEAVEAGLAVAVVGQVGAGAGVEQHLVALEDAPRMLRRPRLEARPGVRRQRLRVAPVVDGVVEHGLAPPIALQDVDQALGLDAVREHGDQAAEAALAHVADGLLHLARVERRLAAVELQVAVGRQGGERLVEHGGRVALVPALGRAVDRAPGAGPVAEVPFVEMQLAQLGVALGEVLDRLVEEDRAEMRGPRGVVQAPVVDVVDDLVVGDPPQGEPGVLRHEAEHAATVLLGAAGLAREVLGVYLEDARDEDAARVVVDAQVPLPGQELLGGGAQRLAQALSFVGRRPHRRAAVRAAVDGEVDARLGELPAQDLVLDVVQAERAAARDVLAALEELAGARLPHRGDRILGEDGVQGERVVGVEPVGEAVLLGGKARRIALRAGRAQPGDHALEDIPPLGEARVVDLALRRHDLGEQPAPRVVTEGLGHQRLARLPPPRLAPRLPGPNLASSERRSSACSSSIFRMLSISTRVVESSSPSQRVISV